MAWSSAGMTKNAYGTGPAHDNALLPVNLLHDLLDAPIQLLLLEGRGSHRQKVQAIQPVKEDPMAKMFVELGGHHPQQFVGGVPAPGFVDLGEVIQGETHHLTQPAIPL